MADKVIGNASSAAGVQVVDSDLTEQLALLDALPAPVRDIVWRAPIPMDLREVSAVLQIYGTVQGRRLIIQVLDQEFPNWRNRNEPAGY